MKLTWAGLTLVAWFGVLLLAIAGAVMVCVRQRFKGVLAGGLMVVGGLLTFGFVSGIIGLYELDGYAGTAGFWLSMLIGLAGMGLFGFGIKRAGGDRQ